MRNRATLLKSLFESGFPMKCETVFDALGGIY